MSRIALVLKGKGVQRGYWAGKTAQDVLCVSALNRVGQSPGSGTWAVNSVFVHSKVIIADDKVPGSLLARYAIRTHGVHATYREHHRAHHRTNAPCKQATSVAYVAYVACVQLTDRDELCRSL